MFDINEPATIKNVTNFFEKDFEKYQAIDKTKFDIKSVDYSKIKVNGSSNNSAVANRYIFIINAQQRLACVKPAIENCNDTNKIILTERYLNNLPAWQVEAEVGYGHTQFYVHFHKACLEFADNFLMEQLIQGVDDIQDLHAYSNN